MNSLRLAAAMLLLLFGTAAAAQEATAFPTMRFRTVLVEGMTTVRDLQRTHGPEGFQAILHLNRIDLDHLRQGATLIVPESPVSLTLIAPFPRKLWEDASMPGRMLIVSRRIQAFAAYEAGTLIRWGAVSTGRRETPTPDGLFATNWRSKLRKSSDNPAWLLPWYFNFINSSGVSFHQFDLPGYPASHACVRLLEADAVWIYEWAESWVLADQGRRIEVYGTPVLVFGDYDYGKPGPWTRLPDDPNATTVTLEELERALDPHRETIRERAKARQPRSLRRFSTKVLTAKRPCRTLVEPGSRTTVREPSCNS